MVKLASRVLRAAESATINVSRRAAELSAAGADLIDLGAGEPAFRSPTRAVEAAIAALSAGFTRYTSVDGIPDLRQELASYYARRGGPWSGNGDVVITVGAKSALLGVVLATVEKGDEVVIPSPCWVSLPAQVELASAQPVLVRQDPAQDYRFDVDSLLASCSPKTRMVLINSPCNPTGAVLSVEALGDLVDEAAKRDILVVLDATYEHFLYGDGARSLDGVGAPLAQHAARVAMRAPEHFVYVSSFSKAYAMTGWRVGYALGPADVIAGLRTVQSHATTHPTSFAMVGACEALRQGEGAVAELVERCDRNRRTLVGALDALSGVRCALPEGAFYALPDISPLLSRGVPDSASFAQKLLEEEGVVTVPGSAFGAEGYLRLSFAADPDVVDEGVRRLTRFVNQQPEARRLTGSGGDGARS